MWVFLSRRLRTWVLLAVALPAVRMLVHKAATSQQSRSPDATPARLLVRADSALTTLSERAARGQER